MYGDKSAFTVMEQSLLSNVTVADGSENRVKGVGYCLIKCAVENVEIIEIMLRGVLYVPTLKGNMISINSRKRVFV